MRLNVVALIVWATASTSACADPNDGFAACSGEGDAAAVITACTTLIDRDVLDAENAAIAHNNRGLAYARLGDNVRALAEFDAAIALDPTYANAFTNRGGTLALQGDFDRAMGSLDEAIRLEPRDVLAYRNRALIYQARGDYERAVADFSRGIDVAPDDVEVRNGRCWARILWRRDLDEALSDCNHALRLDPRNANALNSRAGLKYLQGDYAGAASDYDASYTLAPSMTGSLYGRGLARIRSGQTAQGREDVDAATARESSVAARYASYGISP